MACRYGQQETNKSEWKIKNLSNVYIYTYTNTSVIKIIEYLTCWCFKGALCGLGEGIQTLQTQNSIIYYINEVITQTHKYSSWL